MNSNILSKKIENGGIADLEKPKFIVLKLDCSLQINENFYALTHHKN